MVDVVTPATYIRYTNNWTGRANKLESNKRKLLENLHYGKLKGYQIFT